MLGASVKIVEEVKYKITFSEESEKIINQIQKEEGISKKKPISIFLLENGTDDEICVLKEKIESVIVKNIKKEMNDEDITK